MAQRAPPLLSWVVRRVGDTMYRRWSGWVCGLALAAFLLNGVAYIIHSNAVGNGGAVHREDGRYWMNNHGRVVEITEDQASGLRAHGTACLITFGFAMLAVATVVVCDQVGAPRGHAEPGAAPDPGPHVGFQ